MVNKPNILKNISDFYSKIGIIPKPNEFTYLGNAITGIDSLWTSNFNQIKKVKCLIIGEAPLWGQSQKYIYNPNTPNSQFFYRSDLESVLNIKIKDKQSFIDTCNQLGILFIDISPYALNKTNTSVNYAKSVNGSKKLSKQKYINLVKLTFKDYFSNNIKLISMKKSDDIKVFFRYVRVKNTFINLIAPILISNQIITNQNQILDISQRGGGVNRKTLKNTCF